MAHKRKKSPSAKKQGRGLFFVHKHLRWLLPLFGLAVLFLFIVSNKPPEEYVMGVSTANNNPPPTQECKTGLNSFQVLESCAPEKFRYVSYTCYDGSSGKEGGPTSCKTSGDWQTFANKACAEKSSCTGTPTITHQPKPSKSPEPTKKICKKGLNSFSVNTECSNNKFRYAEYTCYDGSKGKLGSETSCKTPGDWQAYAKKVCSDKSSCKGSPTPSKKLTPKPTKYLTPKPTKYLTPIPSKATATPTPQLTSIPITPTPTAKP
ncbi:hypothetical protein HY345_01925 [Candidatus Microgenomates bacterium]|nr:hypothetical protein [Candidatus Microgenomates bacterium]